MLRMLIGLGNPGASYADSRHNLGFLVLDEVARKLNLEGWRTQNGALVLRGRSEGGDFLLVKPQTFMNLSGRAVCPLLRFYKMDLLDSVIVCDDLDLQAGCVRLRRGGSDGGHRGLRSIFQEAGSQAFKRIRIGIGRPQGGDLHEGEQGAQRGEGRSQNVAFVLSAGAAADPKLRWGVCQAAQEAKDFLLQGCFQAQSFRPPA